MAKTATKAKAKKKTARRAVRPAKKSAPKRKVVAAAKPAAVPEPKGHGTWCWHELMTRDAAACKAFYTALFGWETHVMEMPGMTYTLFRKGGTDVAGMMAMNGPEFDGVAPHWLSYVQVDDVDASAAKVVALGGTVTCAPRDIPGIGRFAVLRDPKDGVLAIFTPKTM